MIWLILIYVLTILIIDVHTPAVRLLLIPILILFFRYKNYFEEKLNFASRNIKWKRGLFIILAVLLVARGFHIENRFHRSMKFVEDIAILNVDGVNALFTDGKNPYSARINDYVVSKPGFFKNYYAYKYPPLQLLFYAPFVKQWGLRGVFAANLFIYIASLLLIFFLLRRYSYVHASLGAIFFLITDYYFVLAFNKGTNDFPSSFVMFAALVAMQSGRKYISTIFLSVSLLLKQLPAGFLFILLLFQKKWKECFLAGVIFVIGCAPFLFWDFTGFYENVVEFMLVRPSRETSFLSVLPSWVQTLVQFFGIAAASYLAFVGNMKSFWSLEKNWMMISIGIIIFLISAKMSPTHYFVWATCPIILMFICPLRKA